MKFEQTVRLKCRKCETRADVDVVFGTTVRKHKVFVDAVRHIPDGWELWKHYVHSSTLTVVCPDHLGAPGPGYCKVSLERPLNGHDF